MRLGRRAATRRLKSCASVRKVSDSLRLLVQGLQPSRLGVIMSRNSGVLGHVTVVRGLAVALLLSGPAVASAQDRSQDRFQDRYWDGSRYTRLQPGMTISVRTNEAIDSAQTDYRVYSGIIDEDVRGDNGRIAIARGSTVEMIVRRNHNNELWLDLESVMANGQRYAIDASPDRVVGTSGSDTAIGSIVGAITGSRGTNVHIPRNTVINFRLETPLEMNIADRGVNRDGYHYHDYYGDGRPDRDREDRDGRDRDPDDRDRNR